MLRSLFSFLVIFILSIQFSSAIDYYWVGGSGNWTDYSHHWAKTTGGNVFHTQVPGPLDNIYFDNNSLSGRTSINLDQTIESCKDISVAITTDTLLFNSSAASPKLSIYGSTLLSPRLKVASGIKLYFEASSGSQTFNQNRAILPCSLVFNNAGNWQITDSINVYSIEILKGTFNASFKKIRAGYFIKNEAAASVNITNSIFYTYTLKLSKSTDVISGINIHTMSGISYSDYPQITLDGITLGIDSIFSSGSNSLTLDGNAHIKYIRIANTNFFNCNIGGLIDRIDAPNLSYLSTSGYKGVNPSIGILNISNLKSLFMYSELLDISQLNLTSNSDCNNLLQIGAIANSMLYKLNIHNNTSVTLNYCSISNIDASAFPLKINNAVDGGGNTGITFLSYAGEGTLYRIGDGAWSDITKWSLTSNGPPANCQPTIYTNVVFDAFSFTKSANYVSFNYSGSNAVCKNITVSNITSSITFNGDLRCYGDLIFSSEVKYQDLTSIYLCAKGGINKIKFTNGSTIAHSGLSLNVIGTATYNFLSDIVCDGFRLENAKIYTNGFNMTNEYSIELKSGNFYGSTSFLKTSYFYNAAGSSSDFQSTHITCSTTFDQSSLAAPIKYGTVILTGGSLSGSGFSCEIKHLKITGSVVTVNNSIVCDSLSISKGILFDLHQTSLMFNLFYIQGDPLACGKYTHLKLSESSFKSGRNIIFDQFILENVNASVSAFTYKAINSIDASNNTGIQFSQSPMQKTFYWINGAGNWSDQTHWSYTSGGATANCIPTRIDNVIFNANSLTSGTATAISIDGFFECKNFSFSNTSKITFSGSLNVFGSFAADSNARFNYIYLLGSAAATVDAKKALIEYIIINKTQATTFVSDVKTYLMQTKSGTIRLIHTTVDADQFTAVFENTDSLVMRNSKIYSGTNFYLNIKNGRADCASGSIEFAVKTNSNMYILISDSIPIHIGKIIMNYDKNNLKRQASDMLSLMISNAIIDSIRLENTLELIVELQLYNTKINTLQAYNNNLRLVKSPYFDMTASMERSDAQPANQNNIINAQLESYKIGIVNMTFEHLKVYPGSTLEISPGDTLYINKTFDATGAPSYPIQISSSMNGSQGYIQNNGAVFGEYLFIQDNYVLNNTGYAGYYSSDVVNNRGWNFGVLYDTILCSFNRVPCEKENVRLMVIADLTLTNSLWKGPRGFTSTNTSPILSNLSAADNGIYTFTSVQGTCMVDLSVFNNTPNNIVDNLNSRGVLTVEDYASTPIWYLNNSVLENEIWTNITPSQTGYYKALTTSNRGCKYMSDSIYYLSPSDPLFKPILTSIERNTQNDITITWTNVENEAGYNIYATTPYSPSFIPVGGVNADVLTYTFNSLPPGDYCYYVKAYLPGAQSLPSNTLCINIPNFDNGTTTVQPQLTYIGLNSSNNIEIRWNDVSGESDYTVFIQTPTNQTVYTIAGNADQDATSFVIPNTGIGQYCLYIQANLINTTNISLPSTSLCIDVADPISTGIRNTKISTGTIYPNPTNTGAVTICPVSQNTLYTVRIETLQGENVFTKENQIGTIQVTPNLKQGVYLIKLQGDSFTLSKKLIVTQ